ncbi:disease resistance protein RPH8A-like [Telopea speciosissima]|uniref:disease resistance protein RPH8A-like n=1 Tax=Telopea speciosissima TaxID=54955 RepID=UPI001CC3B62B|nr:disease resistance protein RPH8A-like [Telopea speciosissima]
MAERAVTFLIGKLGSLISQESNFLGGVETQIVSLHDELEWINSFLRDADEKRRRYRRVNVWVSQVRNLAYDAENIIDLFMLEVVQQRQRNIVLRFMGYPKHLFTLHKFGNQIEDIKRRIGEISANKSKYGIETLEAGGTSAHLNDGLARKVRKAAMEDEIDVIGFEKHIEELAILLKQEESRQLVVSIVGMGGIGKSTLVKTVYNRSDVKNTFDSYAWIYVSQEYRVEDLLSGAITQLMRLTYEKKEELETKNVQALRQMLFNYLKERRCLLVFDDVWRREDWDTLKVAFLAQDEGKQQRVVLTTRNVEVAKHADPLTAPYELRPLGDQESFKLFSHKVFQSHVGSEERSYSKKMEDLGRKLVAKCGGLPLAIVVLGGLLSTKEKTPSVWSKVLQSVNWQLNQGPQQCMDILALSYTDLPYYLQSCFLYVGLFPEDHKIHSKKLIRLWVAEDFIQQRGDETMEDVAEEYLEELTERSMIQVASRRSDGGVETCRVHDLLRDLAVSEAKKDKLLEIYGSNCSNSLNRFRRLAIHSNNGTHHISSSSLYHLHSLLCFSKGLHKKLWKGLYVGFNLLRVLDIEDVKHLNSLPKEIGGLVLLKYLNLRGTNVRRTPHSMGNLCNLQTLDLSYTRITHIPKEIWSMQQLRHLYCFYIWSPSSLVKCVANVVNEIGLSCSCPPRIDNLRDLQTLWLHADNWIEGGLDKLTNLRELRIRGDLALHTKALTDSIVKLKKLQVLDLWNQSQNANPLPLVSFSHHVHLYNMNLRGCLEKIPDPMDFPPYLTELRLSCSHLKQDDQPMATLKKLPNLKILILGWNIFEGKEMICSVGGFAKLQILELIGLYNLEDLKVEQGAFPCLKVLTISWCKQLKMLSDGLPYITTLQELNIVNMPEEFNARFQKDKGKDWEKIKHIPSVTISSKPPRD